MEELSKKTAIITGGGTGIGQGVALQLASEGTKVVICGRRESRLEEVLGAIRDQGGEGLAYQADVSDAEDVDRLVRKTQQAYGDIDILINNAGIGGGGAIHNHDIQTWDEVMAVNLRGPFLTSRAVLPGMRAKGQGHIINISSESGLEYYQGDGAYGVSKHALNALGEFIQRENQDFGVRVDTICPGMVITEMSKDSKGLDHRRPGCLAPDQAQKHQDRHTNLDPDHGKSMDLRCIWM
jgi:NAD(P)-dependent dehydrogenase (short-subunit alcohol dehydrogenase family)